MMPCFFNKLDSVWESDNKQLSLVLRIIINVQIRILPESLLKLAYLAEEGLEAREKVY